MYKTQILESAEDLQISIQTGNDHTVPAPSPLSLSLSARVWIKTKLGVVENAAVCGRRQKQIFNPNVSFIHL
jgi:hypothetical protein